MKALKILNQFSSFKALNQQLEQYTKNQQTKLAGDVFELAVKLYLQTNPKYRTKLKNVWLLKEVKENILLNILKKKEVPVIVPMGIGRDEKPYNINADIVAGAIAKKLNSRRLLLMTDVEGVMDINNKLINEINSKKAISLINEGVISGGMIPKINTCLDSVNNGVTGVVIVDGRKPHSILFELFSDKGAGTLIRK